MQFTKEQKEKMIERARCNALHLMYGDIFNSDENELEEFLITFSRREAEFYLKEISLDYLQELVQFLCITQIQYNWLCEKLGNFEDNLINSEDNQEDLNRIKEDLANFVINRKKILENPVFKCHGEESYQQGKGYRWARPRW